jgi:hypothetical protein
VCKANIVWQGSNEGLTAARKVKVTKLIKDGIRDCCVAKIDALMDHKAVVKELDDVHAAEVERSNEAGRRVLEMETSLMKMKALLNKMSSNTATQEIYQALSAENQAMIAVSMVDGSSCVKDSDVINKRHANRIAQVHTAYRKAHETASKNLETLEKVAKALALDIDS